MEPVSEQLHLVQNGAHAWVRRVSLHTLEGTITPSG